MMKFLLSALWTAILSLIGLQKKDPIQDELERKANDAQTNAQAFAEPDRDESAVIKRMRERQVD